MIRQAISPRLATNTLSNMKLLADDDANGRGIETVTGVVDLRAVGDHYQRVHLRAHLEVLTWRRDPIDDPQAPIGLDRHVHEPVDVAGHVAFSHAAPGMRVQKIIDTGVLMLGVMAVTQRVGLATA